jgi:hypothetical protein
MAQASRRGGSTPAIMRTGLFLLRTPLRMTWWLIEGGTHKLAIREAARTKTTALQHGSIILASRFDEHSATWSGSALRNIDFEEASRRFVEALPRLLVTVHVMVSRRTGYGGPTAICTPRRHGSTIG